MVRDTLRPPVQRMKRVTRERRRDDPLMVRLVEVLIHPRVVQPTVDPVDAEVGEDDEERELEECVEGEGGVCGEVVELGVVAHLCDEERRRQRGHDWDRAVRLLLFELDLVAQEFGVLHGVLVEDEVEGDCCCQVVEDEGEEPVCS